MSRWLALEGLEARALLSTLPAPIVPPNGQVDVSNSEGNESSPSIAVDPTDPLNLAAVWVRSDPKLAPGPQVIVEGATSNDGGQTWNLLEGANALTLTADPSTSNPIKAYAQATDPSVAFDRNGNFYILDSQHDAGSTALNSLELYKYSFSGGTATQISGPQTLYAGSQEPALTPMLAVDNNLASFTDTDVNGNTYKQTDPNSGNVYVAWATNYAVPKNVNNFNPNQIVMIASSDGGGHFSGPITLSSTGDFGSFRYTSPQLAISQGRPADPQGNPAIPGGQVSVAFDDFGSEATANPPRDVIWANQVGGAQAGSSIGLLTEGFTGTGGPIADTTSTTPPVTTPSNFPINVNITNPNFQVSDVSVTVNIVHPSDGDLSIVLVPPKNSGLSPITLVSPSNGTAGVGTSGANMGVYSDGVQAGTVFTDNAPRQINDQNSAAPYAGSYRPETGSLDAFYGGAVAGAANSAGSVNGTWTLRITDTKNGSVGSLLNWSLVFGDGTTPNNATPVTTTFVRGALTAPYPRTTPASPNQGVGPGLSLASDDTLGAFSPNQGRLYLAFVNQVPNVNPTNPASNTDIFMMVSDDGGQSWQHSGTTFGPLSQGPPVNDDNATTDGFSASTSSTLDVLTGRTQYEPQVAVDDTTGTVVLSWLDARNDAANARVATYLTASIDGGQTFSPQVYANASQTAVDAITGQTVTIGPIPENESGGNPNTEGTFGFGTRQGLAVSDGQVHPIWSSNLNGGADGKALLDIRTVDATIAAGPRIVSSTMGPVGLPGDTVNPQAANAATPVVGAFDVTFDRPVDPSSFTAGDVQVFFRDTTAGNVSGGPVPVLGVKPIPTPGDLSNPNNAFGYTQFRVSFAARSAVGTYSYIILPKIQDRIRTPEVTVTPVGTSSFTAAAPQVPQTVTDNTTTTSTIPVTVPVGQVIDDVTVHLAIANYPFTGDLKISLISPDGTSVVLFNQEPTPFGGNSNGLGPITFSDTATQTLAQGAPPYSGTFRPDERLAKLLAENPNGTWTLQIQDLFPFTEGDTGSLTSWSLTIQTGKVTSTFKTGNLMDQNSDANAGELPASGVGPGDAYAAPSPTTTGAGFQYTPGKFFAGPYDPATLPLILPGPHIVSSDVPGAAAAPNNLVLNTPVSAIDVVFDRNMNPASFTAGDILRIMGPLGQISGPFTVTADPLGNDPDPNFPRTFRIGFPAQSLNGTYTVTLASSITSENGDSLDTNLNAGVDLLFGNPSSKATPVTLPSSNVPLAIAPQKTTTSILSVPGGFLAQGVTLTLNIAYPTDTDLEATLISPSGTAVQLFTNVGAAGGQQGFSNTVFDDAAATPIQNGGRPFFGAFKPQQALSAFNGEPAGGNWQLLIKDDASAVGVSGTLKSWSLTFQKSAPISDLGEPVADQATVGFRILTTDPTNPLSSQTWAAAGPSSVSNNPNNPQGYSGQIGAVAVDPADPSGNTVYVGGASGGIWKTTDFLTTGANGPTYIPLTNFGPSLGTNIGSIAIFDRNGDPKQSIIIAGTGFGDDLNEARFGNTSQGIGFLRSEDGGATWTLLDSTNNSVPFAQRDHIFAVNGGTSTFKVVVDPRPTPDGNVIIYAALSGTNGGLWRSVDTGDTWEKMSTDAVQGTNATDVTLDLNSGTVNAVSNPTGNINVIYAAFQNSAGATAPGVYISPNRGQTLDLMMGNGFDPQIRDPQFVPAPAISVGGGTFPTSVGRIVLAKPALVPSTDPNADVKNLLYEGWLYAAVAQPNGNGLLGLFVTKDDGATWSPIRTNTLPPSALGLVNFQAVVPNNDVTQTLYDPTTGSALPASSNYNISLAVDPTNPNIIYLGGTSIQQSGLIRIDTTKIFDSHAELAFDNSQADGGKLQINTTGRVQLKNPMNGTPLVGTFDNGFSSTQYLNLIQNPVQPFLTNATVYVSNVNNVNSGTGFTNNGAGVTWIPFDQLLNADPTTDTAPSTGLHRLITMVDPLTGQSRLIVGDDQGIFTGVDNDGKLGAGIGTAVSPTYSRNGNLQLSQFFYGAAQPSALAAQVASDLLYGNGVHTGIGASTPDVLSTGDTVWTAPSEAAVAGIGLEGEFDGVGIATDQQGRGIVYQYVYPGLSNGGFTDFFQVSTGGGAFVSRTQGLIQNNGVSDPQWPTGSFDYGDGIAQGNFAVNPVNGDEVIISSNQGRIFSTTNQGVNWLVIGDPASLDGTYAPALAFGAPDPSAPAGIGNLNNFLYAGTVGGHIFVSQTGGGTPGLGNQWTDISTGLDGSPVLKIITDPTRGSHDAYAVTEQGVYFTTDSLAPQPVVPPGGLPNPPIWTNISGNLFQILDAPFGNAPQAQPQLQYLTSIVADWRYAIPNNATQSNGPSHPVLYVSGESGVYRSLDNGQTWSLYPSLAFDGAPRDGGLLPNVHVTDLNLAIGNIDPTTGRAVAQSGDPNALVATTFGQGTFTIRLAPIVFPNTAQQPSNIHLDASLPAPAGSVGGTASDGTPLVTIAQPFIDGLSEQSAFGNTVFISLYDLTNPSSPKFIGGFNPNDPSTKIAANETDSFGHFSIQINPGAFAFNGKKTIGIQATDASGTRGDTATFVFTLQARNLGLPLPPTTPTIGLDPNADSSHGKLITNVTTPDVIGATSPNTTVSLFNSAGGNPTGSAIVTATSDASGNYILRFPTALPDGVVTVQVRATNSFGTSTSAPLSFTIDTHGPTTAPTLGILAADDTGVKGDGITASRTPHFVGTAEPKSIVDIFNANDPTMTSLAETTADATGAYSIQLPSNLVDGTITLEASARDVAGNVGPISAPFQVTIVTVPGDYNGDGKADLTLYQRVNPSAEWLIQGVSPAAGTPFGAATDIPLQGDFNGDGQDDLAVYRPSTATWYVQGVLPANGIQFGLAGVDEPVPADYGGVGHAQLAVYRPTTAQWFISGQDPNGIQYGNPGDIAVPGDYLGTGKAQIAIYRPSTGQFFIQGQAAPIQLGSPNEVPVPAQYDNSTTSHKTEPAVYDPSTGVLTILGPSNVARTVQLPANAIPAPNDYDGVGSDEPAAFDPSTGLWSIVAPGSSTPRLVAFGASGEVPVASPFSFRRVAAPSGPVPGDYNGDGTTDLSIFTPSTSTWSVETVGMQPIVSNFQFGAAGDIPVPGDYLGNGQTQIGVFQPSTQQWFTQANPGGVQFGTTGDVPVQGDYLGNGSDQIAVFRPSTQQWFTQANPGGIQFGTTGDVPVPGDYLGNRSDQIAVFRPSTQQWFTQANPGGVQFGTTGDIPVPGDYLGNGSDQIAVFRPSTQQWFTQANPGGIQFGTTGDIPVPGNYLNDGHTDIAVYRPSTGQWFVLGGNPNGITFGGPNDVPASYQYPYRSGQIQAMSVSTGAATSSVDLGVTAAQLSTTVPTTSAPSPTVSTGVRPATAPTTTAHPKGVLGLFASSRVRSRAIASRLLGTRHS